ncbi:MAG: hypothetical protein GY870_02170 [archaeon]|nr:hypothetical protein [archaeon]
MEEKISCVICYQEVSVNSSGEINPANHINEAANYTKCPNSHPVHLEPCLKQWLLSADKCPVCNTAYHPDVLAMFKGFIDAAKAEEEHKKQEEIAAAERETQQMFERDPVIEDKLIRANRLIESRNFSSALNILFDVLDNDDSKNRDAMFLIGKAHFHNNKFDLAVSNLMKLVKIEFSYPLGFYYLGKSFESIGLGEKAKWAYDRSISNLSKLVTDPNQPPEWIQVYSKLIEEVKFILENTLKI